MDYEASMHDVLERLLHDESAEPRELPLSLLRAITNDLADSQKILADGYSTVYKDVLRNGKVAVKKLSRSLQKDMERFENEVGCLMRMRAKHKNIVRFLGYCAESQGTMVEMPTGGSGLVEVPKRLLFFEYPSGGKLDAYITDASHGLGWRKRYKIIKGICEGLNYLHQNLTVHLNLNPSNIWLVEKKKVPKIHGFDGSKHLDQKQTEVFIEDPIGMLRANMAPEFIITGVVTFKLDIFSLGFLIIQILTGRKEYRIVVENEVPDACDGACKGKYTIGLGQDCMAFCSEVEVEDVVSMSAARKHSQFARNAFLRGDHAAAKELYLRVQEGRAAAEKLNN